ncbi:hypothetical protein [Thiohalorhabdus methylotrophus]|uniref:Uncharacterized protein n=1 Tax=Thiohalorhabdus methylotrophus TaxID=3242694 RepID=A0ABV4TPY9_9GAMM
MAVKGALAVAVLVCAVAMPAQAAETLKRDRWTGPETVEQAAGHPALNTLLSAYTGATGARVEVAHGGGARGSAWAHEVRGWLVALGIPSARIRLEPGITEPGTLRLAVREAGGEP